MSPKPPLAAERPSVRYLHGYAVEDSYGWLRDPEWQKVMRDPALLRPEIRAHLQAENAYTEAMLAEVAPLRKRLFEELKARLKEEEESVPEPDGPWLYYQRFEAGGQHPLFCRRPRTGGAEELLLDGNAEAARYTFFQVRGAAHAPDHGHFAFAVDVNGSEFCDIAIRDSASGRILPERLKDNNGTFVWANDGRTLFYVVQDDHHRPFRILCHRLGEDPAEDAIVYEEADPGYFLSLSRSESGRYLSIGAYDHTTSEVRLIEADHPEEPPRLVAPRRRDLRYALYHDAPRHRFLLLTNEGGAEDFKVMEAPEERPEPANWQDWLPQRPGRLRLALQLFKGHAVLLEREEGLPRLSVFRLDGAGSHEVTFPEAAYSLALSPGYEYDTTRLRFVYSSLATPQQTFDYDLETRQRRLVKQQEIPSGHEPSDYLVERLLAPSHDGAEVPISLIRRKDAPTDGSAPLLLYGYGAYGIAIPAQFQPNRFSLIDRGFTFAIAHVRGGTDKGWHWYREGKLRAKSNSFKDLIAAARFLAASGRAREGNIAIHGGSAGGLLVGAVLNLSPELFRAAVAEVPFVDVLNTMCDDSLPLTPPEWPEWGNPLADLAAFETIRAYSPYDNVCERNYPHILATAGLTDPRVTYWEPAKWVAKLRKLKKGDKLLLLRTYMEAGHAGAAGRYDKLKEVALVYAFLLKVFGKA